MLRRLVPLVLVVLAASLAPVAPAQARPAGAESVRVIIRTAGLLTAIGTQVRELAS